MWTIVRHAGDRRDEMEKVLPRICDRRNLAQIQGAGLELHKIRNQERNAC